MKYGIGSARMVSAERVFLDQENPRHEPYADQDDVIEYLCREEQVLALAKDISKIGLNPLELFALIADGDDAFYAAEGNRRLCAIKLLNDPDLAPADQRKEFVKAAASWTPVVELFAVVFPGRDEVRTWLDRIHAGSDDGRGRRQWKAPQKARNSVYSKNDLALAILDIGEARGFISASEREGRLSTVQRYLGNPLMRDALGLDAKAGGQPTTDLAAPDFEMMFRKFLSDVGSKKITTRNDASQITEYSHKLRGMEGVTGERDERRPVATPEAVKLTRPNKPKKPAKLHKIRPSSELQSALENMPSFKLEQIYYSLCSISLATHTPLLAVGAWSFLETLTAICGRKDGVPFASYLSPQKLTAMNVGEKKTLKAIGEAVTRIADLGNSTKHNKTSAAFNGLQLANDFETMENMLIALAKEAKGKTT